MLRFDRKIVTALGIWVVLWCIWAAVMAQYAAGVSDTDWQAGRAQAIARAVWHNPCNGAVDLAWDVTDPALEGYVSLTDEPCTVHLRPGYASWGELCTTVIHEYGHVAGFRDMTNTDDVYHSRNPDSVMYPVYGGPDPRCAQRGRPFLDAH